MTDLIKREDALAACDIAPPDEWNNYSRDGYEFAADDCKRNIAALPGVTVGVQPLVWEQDSLKGSYPTRFRAKMPCKSGDYSVAGSERKNLWQWFRNGYFVDGQRLHEPMPLNAAKAAAQADYEARVLSALTPTPVADSQPADPVVNDHIPDVGKMVDPAAIREAALREAAAKIQEEVIYLKDQDRELALNLAIYGRDAILALIGETK
jgi:hypothetical protein